MQEITYQDFTRCLGSRLKSPRPLRGQIELTSRCNLNCLHCYCLGREGGGKELTGQQWKNIFDQLQKEGCLWLTLTGGEPFLYPGFSELYLYIRKKGFLVTLFTNGTVISPELIKLFQKQPPALIEISLYGATERVYESVTQVAGSFRKVRENIDRLLEINIPLVLKTVGLKQNKNEILKIKALAEKLLGNKKFKYDSFIFPRLDGDITPCKHRLSAEEIVEIESSDRDMIDQRKKELHLTDNFARPREFLYQCSAWRDSFFIDPCGRLQFCHLSDKYSSDLTQVDFPQAFYKEFPRLLNEKFRSRSKCQSCDLREHCYFCPARAFLETGNEEGPVEYYCQLAREHFKQEKLLQV